MHASVKPLTVVAMAALLTGCAGFELGRVQDIEAAGTPFDNALYDGYVGLSQGEYAEGDYWDSDVFASRAGAAAMGSPAGPEPVSARPQPSDVVLDLVMARQSLVSLLDRGGRETMPADAAEAQVKYDCWAQEQEENFQPKDIAACRGAFEMALSRLETGLAPKAMAAVEPEPEPVVIPKVEPIGAGTVYQAFFDFDSDKLNSDGERVLDRIAEAAMAKGPSRILLTAHADRSGSAAYNMALSQRRAEAVATALKLRGVSGAAVESEALGESQPFVPTADGVSEPQNRSVFVIFVK